MEKKVIKQHIKGQKHIGKTNWDKVIKPSSEPVIDEENPDLAFKKTFSKPAKTKTS